MSEPSRRLRPQNATLLANAMEDGQETGQERALDVVGKSSSRCPAALFDQTVATFARGLRMPTSTNATNVHYHGQQAAFRKSLLQALTSPRKQRSRFDLRDRGTKIVALGNDRQNRTPKKLLAMYARIILFASLISSSILALPAAANEFQTQERAATDLEAQPLLDPFLKDFMIDQLDAGGWACQCKIAAGNHRIVSDFNLDIIMDGEGHVFNVTNDSNEEIRVVLSFSDKQTGKNLGQLEVTVPPFKTRKSAMYYAFTDKSSVHEISTRAEIFIPESAAIGYDETNFVRIYRHHDYVQPDFENRETGSLHCTQSQCSLRDEGGIGGCHGPSFSDC